MKLVAKLLASVDPADKEKAFNGEQITINAGNTSQPAALDELYRLACKERTSSGYGATQPTDQEAQDAAFLVKVSKTDRNYGNFGFYILTTNIPVQYEDKGQTIRIHDSWEANPGFQADRLASVKGLELPSRPQVDEILKPDDVFPSPGFAPLKDATGWKGASLHTKVELDLPKDKKYFAQSDVLMALAKSSGLDIICEDFNSHQLCWYSGANTDFGPSPTCAGVLQKLSPRKGMNWFISNSRGLLVGWDPKWRDRHNHMVSENLIARINGARVGSGAELDDISPLIDLTRDQLREWITSTPEFPGWEERMVASRDVGVWQLYNSLNAREKKLAKCPNGLALTGFDPALLSGLLAERQKEAENGTLSIPASGPSEDQQNKVEGLSDPEALSMLSMRVTQKPLQHWAVHWANDEGQAQSTYYQPKAGGINKHYYVMELSGVKNGEQFSITSEFRMPFPIFMPDKEVKLHKIDTNAKSVADE